MPNLKFKGLLKQNWSLIALVLVLVFTILMLLFFYEIKIQEEKIKTILQQEAQRIEETLNDKFDHTNSVMNDMIAQILKNPHDKKYIHEIMQRYKTKPDLVDSFSWTIFSWTNPQNQIIVDTVYGIMEKPFDLSIRDYIKHTQKDVGKFYLGKPVYGSTSKKWMIPGGVGVNYHDKYLGSMTIGFEIEVLASLLHDSIQNINITFDMFDLEKKPILSARSANHQVCKFDSFSKLKEDTEFIIGKVEESQIEEDYYAKLIGKDKTAIYAKKLEKYPFIFVMRYDKKAIEQQIFESYVNRLKITLLITMFLVAIFLSYKTIFI